MHGSLLLVHDHPWVAEAIAHLAEEAGWGPLHLANGAEQGRTLASRHRPSLVNIDLTSDLDDANDLLDTLLRDQPHAQISMMTADSDPVGALACLQAGAAAVIPKSCTPAEVLAAFDAAERGLTWIPVRLIGGVLAAALHPPPPTEWQELVTQLSEREHEVLLLMVEGFDRPQIAAVLTISVNTVSTHVRNVLLKLGAHSSLEAVSIALRSGIRPLDADPDPLAPR